jgi:hypothetical protein
MKLTSPMPIVVRAFNFWSRAKAKAALANILAVMIRMRQQHLADLEVHVRAAAKDLPIVWVWNKWRLQRLSIRSLNVNGLGKSLFMSVFFGTKHANLFSIKLFVFDGMLGKGSQEYVLVSCNMPGHDFVRRVSRRLSKREKILTTTETMVVIET